MMKWTEVSRELVQGAILVEHGFASAVYRVVEESGKERRITLAFGKAHSPKGIRSDDASYTEGQMTVALDVAGKVIPALVYACAGADLARGKA